MRNVVVTSLLCFLLAGCAGDGEIRTGIGTTGLVGPPGPQGQAGAPGATGATGAVGPAGSVGAQGARGPAGAPGQSGEPGSDGGDGDGGLPGAPGIPGLPELPDVPSQLADSNGSLRGGLGITGNGGVLENVLGNDPLSGPVNGTLGEGNTVDHFIGGPPEATQAGLIPATAGALAGTSNAPLLGSGVGVTGTGGLSQDLLGNDVVSPLLGTSGLIPDNISGGNDNLLGSLLPDVGPLSTVQNAVSQVPVETVGNVLNQAPQLGVLGEGGLTEDLLGEHPTGNLIGTDQGIGHLLSGGNDGAVGSVVNTGSPPLAPVGEASTGALSSLAGNNDPLLGDVAGNLPGGVPSDPVSTVTGLVGGLTGGTGTDPVGTVTGLVGGLTGGTGTDPVGTVTGLVGGLTGGTGTDPVGTVTGLVGGLTSGSPVGGGLPVGDLGSTVGGTVETVTGVVGGGALPGDLSGNLPETVGGLLGGITETPPVGGDLLGGLLGGASAGSSTNPDSSEAAAPRGLLRGRR